MPDPLCTALVLGFMCTAGTATPAFIDVTGEALAAKDPAIHSMAASAADFDSDGDLDLVIAVEFGSNRLLLNDGTGRFSDASNHLPPHPLGDHEDVAVADFDRDGDFDLIFYGEDDQVAAYFLNDGHATFSGVTERLPSRGTANAVAAADIDDDGDADLVVGNAGADFIFVNDGAGNFTDQSAARLPTARDVTQDIAIGDVTGDSYPDLLLGNEGGNALYRNDRHGHFSPLPLPTRATPEETRDADLADVDGDGDLDIYFANVEIFVAGRDLQDRLLLNDGRGNFKDVTATHLPPDAEITMSAAFIDFDRDGDLDLIRGTFDRLETTTPATTPVALTNDGAGHFTLAENIIPTDTVANAFDLEIADFNGDGADDLFVTSRGGADHLLLGLAK